MTMNTVWNTIDISDNIARTIKTVRGMRGIQALVMGIFCFVMLVASASLMWTFDIKSTLDSVGIVANKIHVSLPGQVMQYSAYIIFSLTFAPTVFEMAGASFARDGNTPFQGIVIALSIFDLLTDAAPTTQFLEGYWSSFLQFGIFAYPMYWLAWAVWLVCASFLFEMVIMQVLFCKSDSGALRLPLSLLSESQRSDRSCLRSSHR